MIFPPPPLPKGRNIVNVFIDNMCSNLHDSTTTRSIDICGYNNRFNPVRTDFLWLSLEKYSAVMIMVSESILKTLRLKLSKSSRGFPTMNKINRGRYHMILRRAVYRYTALILRSSVKLEKLLLCALVPSVWNNQQYHRGYHQLITTCFFFRQNCKRETLSQPPQFI